MGFLKTTYVISFLIFNFFYVTELPWDFNLSEKEVIKIGLLIQDSTCHEAQFASELAIRQINSDGGIFGHPVQLIVRSMEGPWGTGSKQTVDLVFNENVWAVLGSHDGRNAHLVEQVIAKTHVPFVSARATDPTLSQAFVPWFFNIVPNSNQQAIILNDEIYSRQKLKKVAIFHESDYDTQTDLQSFFDEVEKRKSQEVFVEFPYENVRKNIKHIKSQFNDLNIDGIVLLGHSEASLQIIHLIKEVGLTQPVFAALSVLDENLETQFNLSDYEGVNLINPGYWKTENGIEFSRIFKEEFGFKPSAAAAFSYDGLNLLVEAIKKSNLNREQVKNELAGMSFSGITGTIEFDKNGNRKGLSGMISVENGIPAPMEK